MSHRAPHSWVTGGESPAFLVCQSCGLEHTTRRYLGKPRYVAPFWIREPEGEWRPRLPPMTSCPWRKWVKNVVGKCYRAPDSERVWRCYGFDPRYGYRMRTCDGPVAVLNVDPREIHHWTPNKEHQSGVV